MKLMRFSNLSMAIQMLAYAFQPAPMATPTETFDNNGYNKAIRAAQRRHDRFYGCTSKYKPHESARSQRRYAARIASGKIPKTEILRAA